MDMLNVYCERNGAGFFAEPLNAVTNFAFIIAAFFIWRLGRQRGKISTEMMWLIGFSASVGVGSISWHTVPNMTTLILDTAPSLFFVMYFIWAYLRTVVKMSTGRSALFVGLYIALTYLGIRFASVLHGALVYTPTLIYILGLGIYHAKNSEAERYSLLASAGVYIFALTFRTIDNEVCSFLPIGTHFLWHTFSGITSYLAMRGTLFGQYSRRANQNLAPATAAA